MPQRVELCDFRKSTLRGHPHKNLSQTGFQLLPVSVAEYFVVAAVLLVSIILQEIGERLRYRDIPLSSPCKERSEEPTVLVVAHVPSLAAFVFPCKDKSHKILPYCSHEHLMAIHP